MINWGAGERDSGQKSESICARQSETAELPAKEERVLLQPLAMASTLSQPLANLCQRVHCTACCKPRLLGAEAPCQILQVVASLVFGIEAFTRQGKHSYRLRSVVVMTFLLFSSCRCATSAFPSLTAAGGRSSGPVLAAAATAGQSGAAI